MVVQLDACLHCIKKVFGSDMAYGHSVWRLHVLLISVWPKLADYFNIPLGMDVSMYGCLSHVCCPTMDW